MPSERLHRCVPLLRHDRRPSLSPPCCAAVDRGSAHSTARRRHALSGIDRTVCFSMPNACVLFLFPPVRFWSDKLNENEPSWPPLTAAEAQVGASNEY